MSAEEPSPTFERIDWREYEASSHLVGRRTIAFLAVATGLGTLFAYHYLFVVKGHTLWGNFDPSALDWLSMLAATVLGFYVVWPLAADRDMTRRYWRRLRRRPLALAAFGFLGVLTLVGLLGPEVLARPANVVWAGEMPPRGLMLGQPPVFTSIEMGHATEVYTCRGTIRNNRCFGTWAHPLGTTRNGEDVLAFLIYGSRTTLQVALITAVLLVPFATIVGTVAAYTGGWVDQVLMRYVDLQQVIPAFLVYLLFQFLYGPSLFAIIVLFGLFDWDRIARQVRGDALRKREMGYILSARAAGSSHSDTVRRHLVPNVANTVVSGVVRQIPFVLIAEVTLTFLGLVQVETPSWGVLMQYGFGSYGAQPRWWSVLVPLVALIVTVGAFAAAGDALREVLDPRGGGA